MTPWKDEFDMLEERTNELKKAESKITELKKTERLLTLSCKAWKALCIECADELEERLHKWVIEKDDEWVQAFLIKLKGEE